MHYPPINLSIYLSTKKAKKDSEFFWMAFKTEKKVVSIVVTIYPCNAKQATPIHPSIHPIKIEKKKNPSINRKRFSHHHGDHPSPSCHPAIFINAPPLPCPQKYKHTSLCNACSMLTPFRFLSVQRAHPTMATNINIYPP